MDTYLCDEDLPWFYLAHGVSVEAMKINLEYCSVKQFIFLSSIRQFDKKENYTVLSQVAERGDLAGMRLLKKADVFTPSAGILLCAIESQNHLLVEWLLENKCQSVSAMYYARYYGNARIVELLLDHRYEIDAKTHVPRSLNQHMLFREKGIHLLEYRDHIWENDKYYKDLICLYGAELQKHHLGVGAVKHDRSFLFRSIISPSFDYSKLLILAGRQNNLKAVKILWTVHYPIEISFLQFDFAKFGNICALNFLHKHGKVHSDVFVPFAQNGHYKAIEWGLQRGLELPDDFIASGCQHSEKMAKYCCMVAGKTYDRSLSLLVEWHNKN